MSTSSTSDPLLALFPRSRGELLSLLFRYPDRRFYLRELVERTHGGSRSIQADLKAFLRAGLIVEYREGRRRYFQANSRSPAFGALCALGDAIGAPVRRIREALEPLRQRIRLAFIFGSVARKTDSPSSDVDLMVIGPVSSGEVLDAMGAIQDEMEQIINPSVFGPEELVRKLGEGSPFLNRVLAEPKLFLYGSEHDLEGLAEERLAPAPRDHRRGGGQAARSR